jgi:hypothetical protein
MLTEGQRRYIVSEIEREVKGMGMQGVELTDLPTDSARAVAAAIDTFVMPNPKTGLPEPISAGRLRARGGIAGILDDIVDKIGMPDVSRYVKSLKPAERKRFIASVNKLIFTPKIVRLSPEQLAKDAFARGYRYNLEGNTHSLSSHGHTIEFGSAKELRAYIDDGTIRDPVSLGAAADDRLLTVRYIGDGQYKARDMRSGDEVTGTPLIRPHAPELVAAGGINAPGSTVRQTNNADNAADIEIIDSPSGNLPQFWGVRMFRELGKLTQDIETATRIPAYSKFWKPLQERKRIRMEAEKPLMDSLSTIRLMGRNSKKKAIHELFISPLTREEVIARHRLKPRDIKSADELRDWYQTKMDIDPDELIHLIHQVRTVDGDINRALNNLKLPRRLEWMRESANNGALRLDTDNPFALATSLLRAKSQHFIMKDILEDTGKMIARLRADDSYKARFNSDRDHAYALEVMQTIHDRVAGTPDSQAHLVADVLTRHFMGPISWGAERVGRSGRATRMRGVRAADVERIVDTMSTMFSGTAMAARPALVVRNFFQSMLPGLKVGMKTNFDSMNYVYKDWRKAFKEAQDAGAIGPELQGVYLMDELTQLDAGWIRRAQKTGLIPYRFQDRLNRVIAYHAGRIAMDKALVSGIKPDQSFMFKTGLIRSSLTVQNQIARMVNRGQYDMAAREYGRHMVDETQFLYSREAAPLAFQGVAGRLVGQFGIWPMSFVEYMGRNIGFTRQRGVGIASQSARRLYGAKFAARWLGMIAGLNAVGWALGIDTSSYNAASPLDFEGGPAVQVLRDTTSLVTGSAFDKDLAWRNLQRAFPNYMLPFRSLGVDMVQAYYAKDPIDKVLLAMGFNLSGERRRRSQ